MRSPTAAGERECAPEVDADLAALATIPGVSAHLNGPIANNFVSVLVPKPNDIAAHLDQAGANTSSLNDADGAMLGFSRSLLPSLAAYGVDKPGRERFAALIGAWSEHFHGATNLIGCEYAVAFTRELGEYLAVPDLLRSEAPGILDRFRDVPAAVTGFLRVNLYLPFALVGPVLSEMLDAGLASLAVSRLEVARWPNLISHNVIPTFPTLIVYAGIGAPRPDCEQLVAILRTVERVTRPLHAVRSRPEVLGDYALPWLPFASVTQGYKLWKRYLGVLGLLDDVYDASTGHALVGSRSSGDREFRHSIESALAAVGTESPAGRAA